MFCEFCAVADLLKGVQKVRILPTFYYVEPVGVPSTRGVGAVVAYFCCRCGDFNCFVRGGCGAWLI